MYGFNNREITKEEYEAIIAGEKNVYDFWDDAAVMGYGLIAHQPYKDGGKYYIPYHMSDSCD